MVTPNRLNQLEAESLQSTPKRRLLGIVDSVVGFVDVVKDAYYSLRNFPSEVARDLSGYRNL